MQNEHCTENIDEEKENSSGPERKEIASTNQLYNCSLQDNNLDRKDSPRSDQFKDSQNIRKSDAHVKTYQEDNEEQVESEAEHISCGKEVKEVPSVRDDKSKGINKSISFYNLIRNNNKNQLDNKDVIEAGIIYDQEIKLNL